ncbi:hypothetical protein [Endozoicomonas sp. ALB032]|uniref:hypothetical protein n=1 Tax=Endozoicomonas sp. ALB032 TaxID=3403082 RepID=UPI003BB597E6
MQELVVLSRPDLLNLDLGIAGGHSVGQHKVLTPAPGKEEEGRHIQFNLGLCSDRAW